MRVLKAVVIGMGVLIAAGLIVVVVTIANRVGGSGSGSGGKPAVATGDAPIVLPAGAAVLETALDGPRLALRLRLADGTMALHVYELATGRPIGAHPLVQAPPRPAPAPLDNAPQSR